MIRETPAVPGGRFAALRADVRRARQLVAVCMALAMVAISLTGVGLVLLLVGVAIHGGARRGLRPARRRTAWAGMAGALLAMPFVVADAAWGDPRLAGNLALGALGGFVAAAAPTAAVGLGMWATRAGRGTGRRPPVVGPRVPVPAV